MPLSLGEEKAFLRNEPKSVTAHRRMKIIRISNSLRHASRLHLRMGAIQRWGIVIV
jgi:hypothetical protein